MVRGLRRRTYAFALNVAYELVPGFVITAELNYAKFDGGRQDIEKSAQCRKCTELCLPYREYKMASRKHFLDLSAVSSEDLRLILDDAKTRIRRQRPGPLESRLPARC